MTPTEYRRLRRLLQRERQKGVVALDRLTDVFLRARPTPNRFLARRARDATVSARIAVLGIGEDDSQALARLRPDSVSVRNRDTAHHQSVYDEAT